MAGEPIEVARDLGFLDLLEVEVEREGLPHVSIEVRQDLVSTPEGADRWSAILGGVLREILADEQLYSILDSASG